MKRKKVPDSEKLVAVNLYIEGRASQGQLAEMYGVRKASVQQWIRNFESMGNDAFQQKNRKYSKKLKHQAVQDYLNGKGSQNAICKKYGIRSKSKLQLWIKMYNSGMSFKSNSSGDIPPFFRASNAALVPKSDVFSPTAILAPAIRSSMFFPESLP